MYEDLNRAFTLRLRAARNEPLVIVNVYDNWQIGPRVRLDIEVRQGGRVIFPRGALWVGLPGHWSSDGRQAREAVLSCVAMRPGDTDRDYFDGYTPEQLDWARAHGETIAMIAADRYGDRP